MALDLSGDLSLTDGLEAVTYTRYALDGSVLVQYAVDALPGTAAGLHDEGDAARRVVLRTWRLPTTLAVSPRRGDRIASLASGTWEVLDDAAQPLGTHYRANCVRVANP